MNPTPDAHPEIEEISALSEDQLAPPDAARVVAHLTECPDCADVRDSLEEIRGLLGSLPGPAPMPEEIADRIDAALAAEAATSAVRTAPTEDSVSRETEHAGVSRETAAARPDSRPARHHPAPHRPTPSRPTPSRPAPSRPAQSGPARSGPAHKGSPRRRLLLATAGTLAAVGLGGVLFALAVPDDSTNTPASDHGAAKTAPSPNPGAQQKSDGRGAAQDLGSRVRALLAQQDGTAPEADTAPRIKRSPSAHAPEGTGAGEVPSCVRKGIGRPETPLAADPDTPYQGESVYLVVLPHAGDARLVDAYAVAPDCVTGSATGPAEVLAKHTYARE